MKRLKKLEDYHFLFISKSFIIRYWKEDTVLNILKEVGFKMEKDLFIYFLGSDSYCIFRKSYSELGILKEK